MDYIEIIKDIVLRDNDNLIATDSDHYNMWDNHLKYVVMESLNLAEEYGADKEIVEIGAMLHDIALLRKGLSVKPEHHSIGAEIAKEILTEIKYPKDKMERVLGCVLHHRSSKNATNLEELCVADADIIAHFSNMPLILKSIISRNINKTIDEINEAIKSFLYKDFNDLSENTQAVYKSKFDKMCDVLLKK